MTEPASGSAPARHHHLVQATIRPLDEDGVTVAKLGTALWVACSVVSWALRGRLTAEGHGWWPWTSLAGVLLGLVGWAWCARRRNRRLATLATPSVPASAGRR